MSRWSYIDFFVNIPLKWSSFSIVNNRKKIIWSEDKISDYQDTISDSLECLRARWMNPASRASVSILLKLSSDILLSAATATNAAVNLAKPRSVKSSRTPKAINKSNKRLMNLRRKLAMIDEEDLIAVNEAKNEITAEKVKHKKMLRRIQNENNID